MKKQTLTALATAIIALTAAYSAFSKDRSILVQSTTSTANSGLYDYLLPLFESKTGIKVNIVAVGTGQAIRNASNCDADVLLVHAKSAEEKFVRDGYGTQRHDLMYNDFVIVGPAQDQAKIEGLDNAISALHKIAGKSAVFASRGDNSGTHKTEMQLWKESAIDPTSDSGKWYRETGSGMGATLNIAVGMGAYAMTDRATWINFKNRGDHKILVQGDDRLFNQYGVTLISADNCPHANVTQGTQFIDWLVGDEGQSEIANYRLNDQQLFYPNAR